MLQVSELAASLSHDPTLQILALKVDNALTELWTRNTMSALSYPYIAALPGKEASVYRLAHRLTSKKGLLRFMNRTFRRSGSESIFAQEPVATCAVQTASPLPVNTAAGKPSPRQPHVKMYVVYITRSRSNFSCFKHLFC
jgi:hypothetical protein